MPRIIQMTDTRRGALGDGRYRDFNEDDTYVVSENTGPKDTISELLADQFVKAELAIEVELPNASPTDDASNPADDESSSEKLLSKQTKAELEATAEAEDVDLSEAKNNAERVEAIEKARLVKTAASASSSDGEANPADDASPDGSETDDSGDGSDDSTD